VKVSGRWNGALARTLYFVLGVVTTLATLVTCANAEAGVLKGDRDNCMYLAQVARYYATGRDHGYPWEVVKPAMDESVDKARQNPDSFVKDDIDASYIRQQLTKIWHEWKEVPPDVIEVRVLQDCMLPGGKKVSL
jgi:hypothetical protein